MNQMKEFPPWLPLAMVAAIFTVIFIAANLVRPILGAVAPSPTPIPTATPLAPIVITPTPDLRSQEIDRRLEAILAERVELLDAAGQQRLVDTYLALRVDAKRNGIPMLRTACSVATRASQRGLFLLEKEAWETCYSEDNRSRDTLLDPYTRGLRNLGVNWFQYSNDGGAKYRGLQYLVLCARLVDSFNLRIWECRSDLRIFVPDGEAGWPPPAASPFMQ